ncbi:MAG: nucleotide exchange factor GrpE [Bacteroidales bacterium]|jgi:molecular chaperone GrpE|nr:nucleotide exchange factor GrpE [Bacteroidales bacterium]MBP8982369.1 nucleotide exchange factor GrpE [Bacteroidales bacterium]NLV39489.1 nucleotide exchange factor GrpE [Bacteroidales bacterium]HNZ81317.1 nucleotide exchange factor GrpE [Bacteroidales bacterium]HOD26187.1 nucleotide exchange factor GrpE [Bacteroidales bacterium]
MNKQNKPKTEHTQEEILQKEQAGEDKSRETKVDSEQKKGKSKQQEQSKETNAKRIQELESKYNQLKESNLRLLAEYENYRKRSMREKAELIKAGGESVLIGILSVVDDFERGLAAVQDNSEITAFKEGMELIYRKLTAYLKQHGVVAIETKDQDFDTDLHEAITTIPATDEKQRGKVVECIQKGYFLHDKVIRFAKVVVAN